MAKFNQDLFEYVADIVAATMEGNQVSIDARGGAAVAEYFKAIYIGLEPLAAEEDDEEEEEEGEEDEEGEEGEEEAKPAGRQPKYEVYTDAGGKFRFRLKAVNGEIIAVSEAYASRAACLKGVAATQKCAPIAKIATLD